MKKTTIASLVALVFASPSYAAETINLDEVTIKANRFEHKESETTYASEIHTAKQIEASGAATLYDFLAQQTSLNLLSNFGNKATPLINLRAYGADNGYQNVVITLDGQRLNNIDGVPQLLGAIPLGNIERIEISKGSGSVIYGDGATAGAIQIYTKNKTGVTVSTSFGNYGQQNHYINAGLSEQYFDLSASLAHDSNDGYSTKDKTGHKDEFTGDTQSVKLKIKPTDSLRLIASATSSHNNARYPNSLTKAQFDSDPSQNGKPAKEYNYQRLITDQWKAGFEYDITPTLTIAATHYREDKLSDFILPNPFKSDYVNKSNELTLSYQDEVVSAIAGVQSFDGRRDGGFDITSKDSRAWFLNTEYHPRWLADGLTLSAGFRNEKVKYRYAPTSGSLLDDARNLNAWDIGANYQFTPDLSAFANYNKAYLAPNIDSFFGFDAGFNTIFNGFIKPQESKTLNIGLNHVLSNNRLKASLFYANLDNEIYLDKTVAFFGTNTNLDETHKYGLELQDSINLTDNLNASVIYNYTRSIIDKEIREDGSNVGGKDLPSAPNHSIVANLNYKFLEHASVNLSQTWRSTTYASEDFLNNATQRQAHYESTNVALNYQYKNFLLFTSINNLFQHQNSTQITNDAIYPVDFVRTWRIGLKSDF
jgi:iron complex outermembrane recepter protein